jgi:hypothetical protein
MSDRWCVLLLCSVALVHAQIRSETTIGSVVGPRGAPVPSATGKMVAEETNFA